MLFGLIFFSSFPGLAAYTKIEVISGKISDYGINDSFMKLVREKITAGTSAIFLMTGDSTTDKVVGALKQLPKFVFVSSNLTKEQEKLIRRTFAKSMKQ